MGTEITKTPSALALAELHDDLQAAAEAASHTRAPNTVKAQELDWRQFETWAKSKSLGTLPAEPATVAAWLGHLLRNGACPSTLARKLATVSAWHKRAGFLSPRDTAAVREVLTGFERKHGVQQKQAAPILEQDLARAVALLGTDLRGTRDRALLLVGWIGAFRRSELCALEVEDVQFFEPTGATALVRRSKTDQKGKGQVKTLPYAKQQELCPVRALRAWLDLAGITSGPVFRRVNADGRVDGKALRHEAVRALVKKLLGKDFTAHSLRAGFVTQSRLRGKETWEIKRQTGHRSDAMIERYTRFADALVGNAAKGLL